MAEGPRKIRYAVVGLGHIAQVAVLPAFQHAADNSQVTALVSDDPLKVEELGKRYGVQRTFSYEQYDDCLKSGEIDAVYIALPNSMHEEYTVRAAKRGIHVLCEKPMAATEEACRNMVIAARENDVKLMVAYRLHFDEANMKVVELVKSGKIGDPRIFNSVFSMQVKRGNFRTSADLAGGPLYDIGIYCINAARYLFQSEPSQVMAMSARRPDDRFDEVDEMYSVSMRFPEEKIANFVCSFGSADVSSYRIVGTKGDIVMEPAYDYAEPLQYKLTVDGQSEDKTVDEHDQFAAELLYFSGCISRNKEPRASGEEGLADVRIINAIQKSARISEAVTLEPLAPPARPAGDTIITRPPVRQQTVIKADSPHQ